MRIGRCTVIRDWSLRFRALIITLQELLFDHLV